MFSDLTVRMLRYSWSDAVRYLDGAAESFRRFVFRHIDATTSLEDLQAVKKNAIARCSPAHRKVCDRIARESTYALDEIRKILPRDAGF